MTALTTAATTHSPTLLLALAVAVAGGVGALLRALLIHHLSVRRPDPLPVGTLVVNASGSLLLGFLTGLSLYHGLGPHPLSVAGIGLCGGYTTWSTASWETVHLVRSGHRSAALAYTFGGLFLCLAAAAAGIALAAAV
jgi:CrcB protein